VVIGIGWLFVRRHGILLEIGKEDLNSFSQLRIVAFPHRFWIEFYFHVRSYALIFDFPFVVRCPEAAAWCGDYATIH